MLWLATAVERAMKRQEVILRDLSGALSWLQAADILGIHPRSLRRWRARYEADQMIGLYDRRQLPSPRKAPVAEVQRVLRLYRDTYRGFNVRHFPHLARRDHGVRLSYSIRLALQEAGLVAKRRARGRHRRRREPRARFGELLHLDGSPHAWLALDPDARQTLAAVLDDATKRLLYAQLWLGETLPAVMHALAHVLRTCGVPVALYTDRAGWAFHTPQGRRPHRSIPPVPFEGPSASAKAKSRLLLAPRLDFGETGCGGLRGCGLWAEQGRDWPGLVHSLACKQASR